MPRILIVECMQEISSFNPIPSGYENFHILRGDELFEQRGRNQAIGGAKQKPYQPALLSVDGNDRLPELSALNISSQGSGGK